MAGAVVIGEIVIWGGNDLNPAERAQVLAGAVAGGVSVVDGEDGLVAGESDQVGEGGMVGSTSQGGNVEEVVGMLPGEHAVEFAFGEEEGRVASLSTTFPGVGAEEGGVRTAEGKEFGHGEAGMGGRGDGREVFGEWVGGNSVAGGKGAADFDVMGDVIGDAGDDQAARDKYFFAI